MRQPGSPWMPRALSQQRESYEPRLLVHGTLVIQALYACWEVGSLPSSARVVVTVANSP